MRKHKPGSQTRAALSLSGVHASQERNTTLVSFDTADFTGLLLWITGLTLYTEISSPEHYVRRAVNHLNAVATWHKLNPEPK